MNSQIRSKNAHDLIRSGHVWFGLAIGIYIFMMSVTGSSLVFSDELEQRLCGAVSTGQAKIVLQDLVDGLKAQDPGSKVTFISGLDNPSNILKVYATDSNGSSHDFFVDSTSGTVLTDVKAPALLDFLKDLHHNLLFGKTGRTVQGGFAFVFQLLAVSGLFLFLKGGLKRSNFVVTNQSGQLSLFKLHRTVGFLAVPVILIWTTSAYNFAFPKEFRLMVSALDGHQYEDALVKNVEAPVSLDEVIQRAENACLPNTAVVSELSFPKKLNPVYRVWMRDSNRLDTEVWIRSDGKQMLVIPPNELGNINGLTGWLTRLHFGRLAGLPGKFFWVCAGLLPALLAITGTLSWSRRRQQTEKPSRSRILDTAIE